MLQCHSSLSEVETCMIVGESSLLLMLADGPPRTSSATGGGGPHILHAYPVWSLAAHPRGRSVVPARVIDDGHSFGGGPGGGVVSVVYYHPVARVQFVEVV